MGCLRRLGCLVLLALLGGVAWVTSDQWRPLLPVWVPGTLAPRAISSVPYSAWAPVTAAGAARAERSLAALGDRSALVFTSLHPAEFAGYVVMDLAGRLPPDGDSTQAAVIGNQLSIRTSLDIRALGGSDAWARVAAVIGARTPLTFAGTFDIVRPGVAEFRVQQLSLHSVPVPEPLIPRVLRKIENGPHPTGVAANALLVNVPPYVADVRAAGGKILIYKSVP